MKDMSNIIQPAVQRIGNRLILRHDLHQVEAPGPDGAEVGWECEKVEVAALSTDSTDVLKGKIVAAIIGERYKMRDEIGLLNEVAVDSPTPEKLAEFAEYQTFREHAIQLARIFVTRTRQELEAKTVAELTDIGQMLNMAERTDGFSAAVKAEKIDMLCDVLGVV